MMVLTVPRWLVSAVSLVLVAVTGLVAYDVATARPARAASLAPVASFGSNPGALTMYAYRPDGLPQGAPLVVALHGCTQDASTFFTGSGWRELADRRGFALVLPQQSSANNSSKCFNWFETGDTSRGQGEAASIRSMVAYAVSTWGLDASRVYVTGLSAGGAMSAVMLATYPDTFAAGSIDAGLPYRCATSSLQAYSCMNPGVDKSPSAWGDLVRAAHPGYTGPRPRVAIWQGQSDTTVAPANGIELRDQFTNVLGVSQTPTATGTVGPASWEAYGDNAVRLYKVAGMGHGTPVDPGPAEDQCGTAGAYFIDTVCAAYHDVAFFGLGQGTPPSPSTTTTTTTATTPPPTTTTTTQPPACVTASNYAHVQAGRAYQSGGYAYALGSNQNLGLYNTYYTATLRESSPGYWERC
jgi:poly(hydroxyalkanoate) depolymerase family esterase